MKNIVKDIKENCHECECSVEKTVEFLMTHGDISYTSDHYREVWFFYRDLVKQHKSKSKARAITLELFKLKPDKFKYILKWAKKVGNEIYPFSGVGA